MGIEKLPHRIEGGISDTVISAPFPLAGADDIPERDTVLYNLFNPLVVRQMPVDTSESLDNMPELVFWIAIVPVLGQRYSARETAKDEDSRYPADYRFQSFPQKRTGIHEMVGHGQKIRWIKNRVLNVQPFLK
jgi:hypothetical protein